MGKCGVVKSPFYDGFCVKRRCPLHPCSQLISAHRDTFAEKVTIKRVV